MTEPTESLFLNICFKNSNFRLFYYTIEKTNLQILFLEHFMNQNFQDALSSFSRNLKRFSDAGQSERTVAPTENQILQKKIRSVEERLSANVCGTYKIYKSPFEALGKESKRAASIESDEKILLDSYNLYKNAMELNKNAEPADTDDHQNPKSAVPFISKVEISCPLCARASYTSGGQFIYLLCWLYFEKGCSEYIPFFVQTENSYEMKFAPAANFSFEVHDRQVFDIVKREFYS